MSRLTIYADSAPGAAELRTEDAATIAAELATIGVRFERWSSPVELLADDPAEKILSAYRPYLDALIGSSGAGSADVVRMRPDTPNADALRQKFIAEHTHTEDEVRFFVHGAGNFVLHLENRVLDVHCEQGDLLSVPANVKHWFDAGERPDFTALRVFTDTSGWVPHYTGENLSAAFPAS
jgi:1,2-dihydroxy-3-keto-5-methylthiopentene dioxygenase